MRDAPPRHAYSFPLDGGRGGWGGNSREGGRGGGRGGGGGGGGFFGWGGRLARIPARAPFGALSQSPAVLGFAPYGDPKKPHTSNLCFRCLRCSASPWGAIEADR